MPRSGPTRHGRRPQALRRHRAAALIALAVAVSATAAAAKPKPPPKPPPPPQLTLLTGSEQGVLRRGEIKIAVEAKRAKKVTVTADFVVDGYPEDYPFVLGPTSKRVGDGDAVVHFGLSARQREVLDFAIKSCHGASLAITAKTEKRTGSLQAGLKLPADC
jgi:hypothetical protein